MKLSKKNKLLFLGCAAMFFLSYQLALKKTVSAYRTYSINSDRNERVSNLPLQMARLSQKESDLDKRLNELNVEDISQQNSLLKYLNLEAEKNKVKLIHFNSPHVLKMDNSEIDTYIFNLEGGYPGMLKALSALENQGIYGAINHIHFEKKKDYRSKRTYLQAVVFLEQVK